MEDEIRKRYTVIGLIMGLVSFSITTFIFWTLGFAFPNLPQTITYAILGVFCLIVTALLFQRKPEWALTIHWLGITNLSALLTAIFHHIYLSLGGDTITFGIWLTWGGFLIIFIPAYLIANKLWKKPHEAEIEKTTPH